MKIRLAAFVLAFAIQGAIALAQNYSVRVSKSAGLRVVHLIDEQRETEVGITPDIGAMAFEFNIKGKDILWRPPVTLPEILQRKLLCGVPILAPWANRIDGLAYYVNGKKYLLNPDLDNLHFDEHRQPIHGLLAFTSRWEIQKVEATAEHAAVTTRIEFWRYPDFNQQFPFPHNLEVTYKLQAGKLEVTTRVENLGSEALPIALGYHPYLVLREGRKPEWTIHVPARLQYVLNEKALPTGETRPVNLPEEMRVGEQFAGLFTDFIRDAEGNAVFRLSARRQSIAVRFGPKYTVGIVWTPKNGQFVCIEPMTAPTNAFNLAYRGLFKDLQMVQPGQVWEEKFWIEPAAIR